MNIYSSAKNTIFLRTLLFVGMVLLLPGAAFSAVDFNALAPLTAGMSFPMDVAVSSTGETYVANGGGNNVLKYDGAGKLIGIIKVARPSAVAVGPSGAVYVGSSEDLSVRIYNGSGQALGFLGTGSQEFSLPANIATDPTTGNVYVVDQVAESVKIYSADGTSLGVIDDAANLPQDVVVAGTELFLLDQPLLAGDYGDTIHGAGIQVYDLAGNFLRSFGSYGNAAGQFISPKGITVDGNGVLYIADSFHAVVVCLDSATGEYLGEVHDMARPGMSLAGTAMAADGRLLVVSTLNHSVQVFGLPAAGYLAAEPEPEVDTVYEDGEDGSTAGWDVYDQNPVGATVTNIYDNELGSRVIELSGLNIQNGYRLRGANGSKWNNKSQFVLQMELQFPGDFYIYVDVETSAGHRYLTYRPVDYNGLGVGEYLFYGLGSSMADGRWHTVVRDLQADLSAAQPGVTIVAVNSLLVRGSGRLDDIVLMAGVPAGQDSDGDGISDVDERELYGTDPLKADSDNDGVADGTELSYWGSNWNGDIDGDGLINLLDTDADGDGIPDGEELDKGYSPADAASVPANTVYGDADSGLVNGWSVYDASPAGAEIITIYDPDRQNQVTLLNGIGLLNGYRLRNEDGSKWHNSSQFVLQFSLNFSEEFYIYIDLETSAGHRYLTYRSVDYDSLGSGEYVYYGLGAGSIDGRWHTVVRDLQADLAAAQPGVTINEVNSFLVRGSGMVDDIQLLGSMVALPDTVVLEDGDDGLTSGWSVYVDSPAGATISNVFDEFLQSRVIELSGSGLENGYRLRDEFGRKLQISGHTVLQLSMLYSEDFYLYIDVETNAGHRYLTYRPLTHDVIGVGEYVYHGLGDMATGVWYDIERDLQADLEAAYPGEVITAVNSLLVRGDCRLDDITLIK